MQSNSKCLVNKVCFNCFELYKGFQKIQEHLSTNPSTDSDTIHDVDNSIKDIINYMKHLMQDTQQKTVKTLCLDRLEDLAKRFLPGNSPCQVQKKAKNNILVRRKCLYMLISSSKKFLMEASRRRDFSFVFINVNKIPKMC